MASLSGDQDCSATRFLFSQQNGTDCPKGKRCRATRMKDLEHNRTLCLVKLCSVFLVNSIDTYSVADLTSQILGTPLLHFYRPQRSWGKVMFLQVSVILFTGGVPDQVHPPGPGTPPVPGTHPDQVHPLGPGTPSDQVYPSRRGTHPWDQVHQPGPGTPPLDQVHTPRDQVHPLPVQSMLGDTVNARTVRILLQCNLVMQCFGKFWPNNMLVAPFGLALNLCKVLDPPLLFVVVMRHS